VGRRATQSSPLSPSNVQDSSRTPTALALPIFIFSRAQRHGSGLDFTYKLVTVVRIGDGARF